MTELKKIFANIQKKASFDELEEYAKPASWKKMSEQEKEQLSDLFVLYGKSLLDENKKKAFRFFTKAKKLLPQKPDVHYKVGVAYTTKPGDRKTLYLAAKEFEAALAIDAEHLDSLYALGNLWASLGASESTVEYFQKANENFQKAEQLLIDTDESIKKQNLYHSWGLLRAHEGQTFGEALDYREALFYFEKAEKENLKSPSFFNDYGYVLKQLGYLISNPSLFTDALRRFKQAQELAPNDIPTLVNLAQILAPLYELTDNIDYFNEAHRCHALVLKKYPEIEELWITWAFILSHYGKSYGNAEALKESFNKYEKAPKQTYNYLPVMLRWSDALRTYGILEDDIGALKAAEEKALAVLKEDPESVEASYGVAIAKCDIGRYFDDASIVQEGLNLILKAIKKHGNQAPLLWHGITQASMALGDITKQIEHYKKATEAFESAVELGARLTPHLLNAWGIAYMKISEVSDKVDDVKKSIEKFEQAIAMASHVMPEWLYNYGCAYDFLGDLTGEIEYYEKAIQVLNHVIEMDPSDLLAHHALGVACSHLGETIGDIDCLAKAGEIFSFISEKDPEDDMILFDWGNALLHQAYLSRDPVVPEKSNAFFKQAEEKLLQSVSMGSVQALYSLACLYSLQGDNKTAMYYLEKAEQATALPALDDLLQDDWIETLRATSEFREFLVTLVNRKEKKQKT